MRLVWSGMALALVGALVVSSMAASEALLAAKSSDARGYARRVAASALSECLGQPYGASYDLSAVANPRAWPVMLQVVYYGPGRTPAYDPAYPDGGLELVTVSVRDPQGKEWARARVLKAR